VASSLRNKPLPPASSSLKYIVSKRENLAKTHREASASARALVTIVLAEEQFEKKKKKNDDGIKKKKRKKTEHKKQLVKLQH
jgi:hypothetical protein